MESNRRKFAIGLGLMTALSGISLMGHTSIIYDDPYMDEKEDNKRARIRNLPVSENPKPVVKVRELPKGSVLERVTLDLAKHGHVCTLQGEVYHSNAKTAYKARIKWILQAKAWFNNLPIQIIIQHTDLVTKVQVITTEGH